MHSAVAMLAWVGPAGATPFFFSSGNPDGLVATGSPPSSAGKVEIETGDDFIVSGGKRPVSCSRASRLRTRC